MEQMTKKQLETVLLHIHGNSSRTGDMPAKMLAEVSGQPDEDAPGDDELKEAIEFVRKRRITGKEKVKNIKRYRETKAKAKAKAKAFYRANKKQISKKLKKLRQRYGGGAGLAKLRKRFRLQMASKDTSGIGSLIEASLSSIAESTEDVSPFYEAAVRAGYLCYQMAPVIGGRAGASLESIGDTADGLSDRLVGVYSEPDMSEADRVHFEDLISVVSEVMDVFDDADNLGEGVEDTFDHGPGVRVADINRNHADGVRYTVDVESRTVEVIRTPAGLLRINGFGAPTDVINEATDAVSMFEAEGIREKAALGSGERFKALSKRLAAKGAKDPDALAAWIGRKKYGKAKMADMAAKGRKESDDYNFDITESSLSPQDAWDKFLKAAKSGQRASVVIAWIKKLEDMGVDVNVAYDIVSDGAPAPRKVPMA